MSPELERLVGRAVLDEAFRKQLLNDPDGAVKAGGFNLTPAEMDQVRDAVKARAGQQDQLSAEIDAASRSGVWG